MSKQQYNYDYLKSFCEENEIILEKDYKEEKITRDTIIEGRCKEPNCQGTFKKNFRCLTKIKNFGCVGCSKIIRKERVMKTNKEKYGFNHTLQIKEFRDKGKLTCLEKYGVEHSLQSKDIREKGNETKQHKYGDKNFNNREQFSTTSIKLFGVKNPSQNENIKNKKIKTCFMNFGVDHPLQNNIIKEKIKNTNKEKYGVENPSQNEDIKQLKKDTCFKNYGVKYPTQNANILEKAFKSGCKFKDYILPSGKILQIQGYENYALDELLNNGILEADIKNGCYDVPEIWYNDLDNNQHRYYVDLYVQSQNKCIEVKSDYTITRNYDIVKIKQQAVKDAGYKCEIWVYNSKGEKVEIYE